MYYLLKNMKNLIIHSVGRGIIDERTNAYKKFPCSSDISIIFDDAILSFY